MNILVTGAFGGIGTEVIDIGYSLGHVISVFELDNERNRKKAPAYVKRLNKVMFGDLRNFDDVRKAVAGQEMIIHLGAVIPPLSEKLPALSYAVNVGGTDNIIKAIDQSKTRPGLVFTSSMSIMGADADRRPPLKVNDPVTASSHYTSQKIECERMLKATDIPWIITRLGAVINTDLSAGGGSLGEMLDEVFSMSLDNRIEGVWNIDAASALISAAELLNTTKEINRKIFFIGGGKETGWQLTVREFYNGVFDALGFGMPDESVFSTRPYYADWLDTKESQFYLKYQNHTFDDFLIEMKRKMGTKRFFAELFAPIIRKKMIRLSSVASTNRLASAANIA